MEQQNKEQINQEQANQEQANQEQVVFTYTYSAMQQAEVDRIRQKYLPKEETKLEQLRKLDAGVPRKGTIVSIALGIIGCLIMGGGMSLCLEVAGVWFVPGIIIGLIGIALMSVAYPIYKKITEKEREKKAPLILQLSEELLK